MYPSNLSQKVNSFFCLLLNNVTVAHAHHCKVIIIINYNSIIYQLKYGLSKKIIEKVSQIHHSYEVVDSSSRIDEKSVLRQKGKK